MKFLRMTPQDLNLIVAPEQPYMIVMDIAHPQTVVSVLAALSGDASIYFSTGGGVIGGEGHESVRAAAITWVREATKHLAHFSRASAFIFPRNGNVCFYVGTPEGVFIAEVSEQALQEGSSPLSALYGAGRNVITALRIPL